MKPTRRTHALSRALVLCALGMFLSAPSSGLADSYAGGDIVVPSVPFDAPLNAGAGQLAFSYTKGAGILALEGGTPTEQQLAADVVAGFQAAGDIWSNFLDDPITVNVTIDFASLGAGILGSTGNNTAQSNFDPTKTALIADATSADDATAIANFQPGTGLDMVTIDTSGSPYPRVRDNDGSANNFALDIPRANLKAIGLIAGNDSAEDGAITFSSNFSWDFDRDNGITGGTFDFVGVAAHEIGHLLGFVSGVDIVDLTGGSGPYAPTDLDNYRVFSILDLYRYSDDSLAQGSQPANGAVLDLAYAGSPFFSIDAGGAELADFSTGSYNGDGRQASHWKDNLGLGLMDPTAAPGEFLTVTALDLLAFDVIGYEIIPEPITLSLLTLGGLALLRRRK